MLTITIYEYSAFQWTFCALAIITTFGRLHIRYRQFMSFQADDLFNILALITLIGSTGLTEYDNHQDTETTKEAHDIQLAGDMLLWITLYLVKASFLALIWCIFRVSANFQKAWWTVAIYTFLTFWPVFLSQLWQCGNPVAYDDPNCDTAIWSSLTSIVYMRYALHVSSDLFILLLPLIQVRNLHMSFAKKISATAVFGLIIIDIVSGIMRNTALVVATPDNPGDTAGDVAIICQVVEPALAVFVCSLPPYRSVVFRFTSRSYRKNRLESHDDTAAAAESANRLRTKKGWLSHRFHALTASIPSPLLEISISDPAESTEHGSQAELVERRDTSRSVDEEKGEKRV